MAKWFNAHKKIGQVGGSVFYIDKGQTIERTRAAVIHNPRTVAQQTQRVKWSNLVHFWGATNHAFDRGFISKRFNQTWYNAFMSANLRSVAINFTREYADMKCAVVAPYLIASGTLQPLSIDKLTTQLMRSSVNIGNQPISTIGNISQRIITNNSDFINGDKLCFIAFMQLMSDIGYPYIDVYKDALTLNIDSTDDLNNWAVVGSNYLAYDLPSSLPLSDVAGIALVHTRRVDNGLAVSTQRVTMVKNYYLNFVGDEALQRALDSYNSTDNSFFAPDVPASNS